MLEKGRKVGDYILLEKLGAGGFGDVWKAEKRTVLDVNHFALKFFRPKDDRIDFDKIGKELGVWKRLKGLPHIISVIELDQFEDYVYVISDFADGGSLEGWLKDTPSGKASSQAEAVKITLEILTGLENLHEKGFVHRDLKPDNILIMNGKFCLADFGISREIKTHSKATGTAGTMEYMPPEAFDGKPQITPQTDIWAIGVILQRLLTGALPYPQEEQPSLIAAILMSEPEPLPESIPPALREIVKISLQKKREDRFQTAREMREALRNALTRSANLSVETILAKPNVGQSKTAPFFESGKERNEATPETLLIDEPAQIEEKAIEQKTENLVISPTQDWREIEKEKQQASTSSSDTFTNSIGMEFVKIPAGSFMMGSENGRSNEKPVHKVTISKDFYMGKYEVTQAQWKAVMGSDPSKFKGDNLPVETVSWDDTQEFIKKLNAKGEGRYRLPTEAEWEYACRAGTTGEYAGNVDSMAWYRYEANSGKTTHPVGTKQANRWGLYDMHGNVWEWCQDRYGNYQSGSVTAPTGAASGSIRVLRGGSWNSPAGYLRSAFRGGTTSSDRYFYLGFRVVRN